MFNETVIFAGLSMIVGTLILLTDEFMLVVIESKHVVLKPHTRDG